jgi:SM-20-related protein
MSDFLTGLTKHGFSVIRNFLEVDEVFEHQSWVLTHRNLFQPAAVGRGVSKVVSREIRSDLTYWIDWQEGQNLQHRLRTRLEALKDQINGTLHLGLWELEAHYSIFPVGAFYQTHVDRFRHDDHRMLSVVLYLNSSWTEDDGGELYLNDFDLKVAPESGTLVCFLSSEIKHEVLKTNRERLSIAGWYRRRV